MPTYYIDSCEPQDQIQLKHGWFIPYKLVLKNEQGTFDAEMLQKPETPPPSGTVVGTITNGPYGNKFKKEKRENVTEYTSGKTPEQQKSIVRQHSQHMAIMWAVVIQRATQERAATETQPRPPLNPNYDWLKGMIDWFQEDAEGSGNA